MKVIGLMSGTSQDGLDIAYCHFEISSTIKFEIIKATTVAYSPMMNKLLQDAFYSDVKAIKNIDLEYGKFIGDAIVEFSKKHNIDYDLVASHGHTIFHKPEKGITLQIGNGEEIARICKKPVVYDFRSQDVALGGQGAPLVPIGDELLFGNYDYCLNIGGISNISFKNTINSKRIAFDVCASNIVLNKLSNVLGYKYDDKGKIAKANDVDTELLLELNSISYYNKGYPKSLGREFVEEEVLKIINKYRHIKTEVLLSTYTEHIAIQIAGVLKKGSVLVTGGGAYNEFLIERIEYHNRNIELYIPSPTLIEYKEALIFALMGALRIRNETNVLSSATGAVTDHCSGKIAGKYN